MNSEQLAWKIRRHGIEMTHLSGGSHIGAILSVADIIAVLYADVLKFKANQPDWHLRDRIILSKGHAGAGIYAALAECGFFPVEELKTHYADGSRLSGHVSHHLPGIDFSTGSLGHGLSAAAGMAYAAKKDQRNNRVFAILGDGECEEGSVWEAALFANHFSLNNLTVIIDHNHLQSLDTCDKTLSLNSLTDKWKAFGWKVSEIDGHDHDQLRAEFTSGGSTRDKPQVIVANTIKGKGVCFMEHDILWHYRFPHDGWEYDQAVTQLHQNMPSGVDDPYTPNGIAEPQKPGLDADIGNDHTMSAGYHPAFQEDV